MEVAPVLRPNDEPGVDIVINKHVVEEDHLRERATPGATLEHRRRRPALAIENDVRRGCGTKSMAFHDGKRVTGRQGTEHCRKGRLASSIFCVYQYEPLKVERRSRVDRVKLANVTK